MILEENDSKLQNADSGLEQMMHGSEEKDSQTGDSTQNQDIVIGGHHEDHKAKMKK
jgi:hypothetical protein